jgi:integrase
MILTYTGMRPSQMMRLDPTTHIIPFVDESPPMVFVPAGKGGKAHWKPLPPGGVAAFHLFLISEAAGSFSTSSFYKSWMTACDEADVPRFNPYKLRHSYATLMRRAGADVADIQELLGHKSPKTTQRYAAVVPEKIAEAGGRFQKAWSARR